MTDNNKWPFFIAEIGVNHAGSLKLAKEMILTAKNSGASAVKFQTYKAEKIASKNSPSYWDLNKEKTTSQFELFKKLDSFNEEEYKVLADYAVSIGVEFMSTAFDLESVDLVDNLVAIHKISSSDITNKPLIEKIASKGKPVILSVGASMKSEIDEALSWLGSNVPVALLHCVLEYPCPNSSANLGQIRALKKHYPNLTIGYSDHTTPQNGEILKCATTIGAEIIEKHYTYDKSLTGNDHYHSFDCEDLKKFINWYNNFFLKIYGSDNVIEFNKSEEGARMNARRGVYLTKKLKKGSIINREDLICKRPYTNGTLPKEIDIILGKQILVDLEEDEAIFNDFI